MLPRRPALPSLERSGNEALRTGLLLRQHVLVRNICFFVSLLDFAANNHLLNSCNNGKLAPPTPEPTTTFRVLVEIESTKSPGSSVEANGFVFRIGGSPSTYCPSNVGTCPAGTETIFSCLSGYCNLVSCFTSLSLSSEIPFLCGLH